MCANIRFLNGTLQDGSIELIVWQHLTIFRVYTHMTQTVSNRITQRYTINKLQHLNWPTLAWPPNQTHSVRLHQVPRANTKDHDSTQRGEPNSRCLLRVNIFSPPMPPHVLCGLRGPPSWAWQECNRLLRLGRPWGATTLSRWCERWYAARWNTRRGLKPKSTNYPDRGHHGNHGRTGNRTRVLMISSQGPWPLDHEAGPKTPN